MIRWTTLLLFGLTTCLLHAQTPAEVRADFDARRADLRAAGIDPDFATADADALDALRFLYAYMSLPDMTDYPPAYYAAQVEAAVRARREMAWGSGVPRREWLHFVVPPRVNNEHLDTFRTACYEELKQRVAGLSMREAVLEVNHWCHEYVTYRPSDARTSSPLATMANATGRCGEESTFTVAALRAVGIPARQVYTPRWAHTDDNHAWVEAWADGQWYFLGACEPEPVLNLGWFNQPASRGMLMHTRVFGRYDGPEDVISRTPCYTEINVTAGYADVARTVVVVTDAEGRPVAGADVDFKLYNYAELYTVVRAVTDARGRAAITAGRGDLVAWAAKDGRYGFKPFSVGRDSLVSVSLTHREGEAFETDFNVTPPAGRDNMPPVPPGATEANERRKAREDSIRLARTALFPDSARAARFCAEHGLDAARAVPLLVKSRANHAAAERFMLRSSAAGRATAQALLETLSEKDLRDFDPAVLEDHYEACMADGVVPGADLGVRIAYEHLSPWRGYFRKAFTAAERRDFRMAPERLAAWIGENVVRCDSLNPLGLWQQPERAHTTRRSDARSCGLLFVAAARAMGIPARIDPVTGKVEYRCAPADATAHEGPWTAVAFGPAAATETAGGHGRLALTYAPQPHLDNPAYYRHFTLSRLEGGRPALREYGEADTWQSPFAEGVSLDAGTYLLTSGTRMADGSVLGHLAVVPVEAGGRAEVPLVMRRDTTRLQVIGTFNSENLFTDARTGREGSLLATTGRGYFVVGLIRAAHEPSNHILHDLEALREELEAWGRPIVLLFPSQAELDRFNSTRGEFSRLPSTVTFGVDSSGQVAADLSGGLMEGGDLPVIVLADTFNRVVFMTQGYTIGIGQQIKQALSRL